MKSEANAALVSSDVPFASFGGAKSESCGAGRSDHCDIRIHLLGQFLILKKGAPLAFGRKQPRKPLALLQMLVAKGGFRADARALSERLWPEAEGDAARKSFDINLHRLRNVVGIRDFLTLSEGKLSIDARTCWTDVWEFEDVVERIEGIAASSAKSSGVDCALLAKNLIQIYAGHFLEHDSQDAWAIVFRDKLKAKFGRAVVTLAACLEQQRKWDQAATLYSRALELDNLAEPLYRRLMICYRELDETAEALKVYRRCRDLLSIVFSVRPSAETEAIRATFG